MNDLQSIPTQAEGRQTKIVELLREQNFVDLKTLTERFDDPQKAGA
jgi:DeoR/GlpR family transcriptional regulator of sugar metabolism